MSAASGQRISAGFGQGMSATRGQLMSASEEGLLMSVVVGVDGSAASRMAIRVAAQEARYRQAPLIAVLAYSGERTLGAPAAQPLATLGTGGDQRGAAESHLRDLGLRHRHQPANVLGGRDANVPSGRTANVPYR